jgi:serine/threonine-protein kinase RsbW
VTEDKITGTDVFELRLPASLTHLPIVRSLAVNLGMRADFDLDAISDIELAVDEACSSLIVHAAPESDLACRFAVAEHEIAFRARVSSEEAAPPSTGTFGWRILQTLTDTASTWAEPGDGSTTALHIALAKHRQETPG